MRRDTIRIGIADDHNVFRQALKVGLSQDDELTVLLEAEDGSILLQLLPKYELDVLLLDLKMPKDSGIEVLRVLERKHPEIRVLILSAFYDEVCIHECLQYNIFGFLTKSSELSELMKAIKHVYRNGRYFDPLIRARLPAGHLPGRYDRNGSVLPKFSYDEIRLIELLKEERSTREISGIMNLSTRSIEVKRDKMRRKANAKTVGGLLLYALRRGFIE